MSLRTITISTPKEEIALITISRPEVLNALSHGAWVEIGEAISLLESNKAIRSVVITGEGRAFSSGADLKESKTRTEKEYRDYLEDLQRVSVEILKFKKPLVAAINGYALGAGLQLALVCDYRIAASDAKLGLPEAQVSSGVAGGTLRLLPALIGQGRAREMLFSSRKVPAKEALEIGLVDRVVPQEKLLEEAISLCESFNSCSALSIALTKEGLARAIFGDKHEDILAFEVDACIEAVGSKERKEAIKKF